LWLYEEEDSLDTGDRYKCRAKWEAAQAEKTGCVPILKEEGDLMETIPFANPEIVYREDFDDWAVLFDPDTAETYGLDEVGSFIWKKIDGKTPSENILNSLFEEFDNVPENAPEHLEKFLNGLEENGLMGYKKK